MARFCTLGPRGPLLQRGVLVVLQSAQTLIVLLLLLEKFWLLLSSCEGDDPAFSSSNFVIEVSGVLETI